MPTLAANKLITLTIDSTSEVVEADASTMLRLGQQALAVRNWALARRYFKRLLELQPDHQDALFHLAAIAPSPQQTVEYLKRILDLNPDHYRARTALLRTQQIMVKQLDTARDPVAAIAELIASCYGPSQPFTEDDWAAQQATIFARPARHLPAASLLRVAIAGGDWVLAGDIICGKGVHPDEMRFIHVETELAERIRCELACQRRQRHAETCYQAARALCNHGEWRAARHQLDRARHFLLPEERSGGSQMNQIGELERIIDNGLNPPLSAAKRSRSRLTR